MSLTWSLLERLGDAQADIAAAGDHDPLDGLHRAPQLAHDGPDVFLGSEQEHFVTVFDDRLAGRHDRPLAAKDGGDPAIDLGR